jgi:hypothetical protein
VVELFAGGASASVFLRDNDRVGEDSLRFIALLVAVAHLVMVSGCSQVVQIDRDEAVQQSDLKNVTIRTKSGDMLFFENAAVYSDSLRGFAQETKRVYLEGGEVSERVVEREARVALTDIEQLSLRKRNWGKTALLVLGAAAVVGAIVLITSQSDDPVDPGDGSGGGKPPLPTSNGDLPR